MIKLKEDILSGGVIHKGTKQSKQREYAVVGDKVELMDTMGDVLILKNIRTGELFPCHKSKVEVLEG